ncbi:MAG: UDP-N-acetylmuramoyl-L-alanine--D-glutamate ligase [Epulopiscium sp.]|nr:UDP-N-acetylmuramoyl-L-alanine--D-glutamate ligase [Candidatus Epulonipiscium sp.]HOQ16543.1 UDP-N-acetylmuramoyl-L-alanine--D-glutamate ligase [Defluviitaleaceae bacterium]HPT75865.1 UDP-N-acetylmuramoyl-L-alanine--D-glutamate ligase [Defluviitaleaceae bacterium]
MDWCKKNVLVVGMAKSGISAAKLCSRLGAKVTIQDVKSKEELMKSVKEEIDILDSMAVYMLLGEEPTDIIDSFDLIVLSPGVPTDLEFLNKARQLQIPIWSEIELAFVLCPCPVIAITGTNGKTTTTTLVGEIMKKYNPGTQVVGNIGIPFTEKVEELKKEDLVVAEISSFQLESIHTFKPKVSAILNITPDHLNRHKSLENYVAAKERIFENQDENDYCVLNDDDDICSKMKHKTKAKALLFSRKKELNEGAFLKDNKIWVRLGKEDEAICLTEELRIPGNHNIENVLAAVAISVSMGVPPEIIRDVVIHFKGVEHRIEFVDKIDGVEYYNDSKATNVDAAIIGIQSMKAPVVLIGGGMDKGADFSEWIDAFDGKVKALIVMGETADKIIKTANQKGFFNIKKVSSIEEAVRLAKETAQKGDCVLLSPACASWDMFKSYEERGKLFKKAVYALRG